MRPLQLKVVCVDAGGFGGPGAGSCQEEQKCSVAPTTGRLWIGRRDEGVHFGRGEVVRHVNVRPFNGNRQHALGDAEGCWVGGSDVAEERSDRGQAGVARGDGIVPLLLEFVEKSENEISISSSSANAPGFFRNRAAAKRISMRKASR